MLKVFTDTHNPNSFAWLLHWWYHYCLQWRLVGLKVTSVLVWYFNSGPLSSSTNSGLPYTFHPTCTVFSHTDSPPLSVHTPKSELSTNLETDGVPGGGRGPLSHSQTSSAAWEWDHLTYWPHRLVVASLKWVGLIIMLAVQKEYSATWTHTWTRTELKVSLLDIWRSWDEPEQAVCSPRKQSAAHVSSLQPT